MEKENLESILKKIKQKIIKKMQQLESNSYSKIKLFTTLLDKENKGISSLLLINEVKESSNYENKSRFQNNNNRS